MTRASIAIAILLTATDSFALISDNIRESGASSIHSGYTKGRDTAHAYLDATPADRDTVPEISKTVPADTIDPKVRMLEEVTVKGDDRYITDEKTVYIPDKQSKKIASSGVTLLSAVGIPSITINPINNSVTTLAGKNVSFFIDYLPADDEQVKGIRPEDVSKIEILDYPSDIRFQGAEHVVNFIMVRYAFGGYTKLDGNQSFECNIGEYSVKSKLSYKKTSYDIGAGFNYLSNSHNALKQTSIYLFPQQTVESYLNTERSRMTSRQAYVTGRVVNNIGKAVISNTAGFSFNRVPKNYSLNSQTFNPMIFTASEIGTDDRHTNRSVNWKGSLYLGLSQTMSLMVDPSVSYSSNDMKSLYEYRLTGYRIDNTVDETAVGSSLKVALSKRFGQQTLTFAAEGGLSHNDYIYSGTSPASEKSRSYYGGGRIRAQLRFGAFILSGQAGVFANHTSFGNFSNSEPSVNAFVMANYKIDRRQQIGISSEMSYWGAGLANMNPNLLTTGVLDAIKGNPDLKMARYNSVSLQYLAFLSNIFNIGVFGSWSGLGNSIQTDYMPVTVNGREMMLRSFVNSGFFSSLMYGANLNVSLFNNSLKLTLLIGGSSARRHGVNHAKADYFLKQATCSYSFRNFHAHIFYQSKIHQLTHLEDVRTPMSYGLGLGYGNGNLNVGVTVTNFFNNSWKKGESWLVNPYYIESATNYGYGFHRNIRLSITYSFGYGKKIERGDEVDKTGGAESGVLL